MVTSNASTWTNTLGRIGLWFGSFLVAVALFSIFLSLLFSRATAFHVESVWVIFYVTMKIALPVWCLYLPFVIAIRNAEGWRIWTILVSGLLIGPASFAIGNLILLKSGADPQRIWNGDPLIGVGLKDGMVFALIVGFLTTSIYVFALKRRHRPTAGQSRVWRGAI